AEALEGWSRCQAAHGVTAFMLTTGYRTAGYDYLCGHIDEASVAAKPLGVYLESPFCSLAKRGGISEQRVGEVSLAKLDEVHATLGDRLVMMTVAPERENAIEVIGELVRRDIIAAIGHTDCTYEQALAAVDAGATHVTHCFNAMRGLHHRDPGPLPLVLTDDRVHVELILDGKHVLPPVVRFAVGVRGVERTCVVTDNMRAAGLPPGDYTFRRMEQTISVKDGVPRLPDGTIAGSCLTMDRALANVVAFTGLPLTEAVMMLTSTPARAARVDLRKGRLAPGFDADVVIFDRDFNVVRTLVGGKTVYRHDAAH
ncbi:MAG TPA: amidohydrolase family protein, partial [Planctomycetota bacterium]|nr:amidohydrolase family protein [Planctomycetota bacterium]